MTKNKNKNKGEEEEIQSPPTHPPVTEVEILRSGITEMEENIKQKLDSGTATPQEQREQHLDHHVLEQKHFQLRKILFREQIHEEFSVFEQAILIEKHKTLPLNMDTSKLSLVVELIEKVKFAESEVMPMLDAVRVSDALINIIKAKNLKIGDDIQAMVNDLRSQRVMNNNAISKEEREKKRLLGDIAEVQPIWVAFHHPQIFNEIVGDSVLSPAVSALTPIASGSTPSDKTVGSKPSDLTPEEHKAMLNALKGEAGKQAVQIAISEGACSPGNKEIFDIISQKVLGKRFAHIGSLDTFIYNIRGVLNLR